MNINVIREKVKDMYPTASWVQRVNQMPDKQVYAIFRKQQANEEKKKDEPWRAHRCGECKMHNDADHSCDWHIEVVTTKYGFINQGNMKCSNAHKACRDFVPKDPEKAEYVQMTIFDFIGR